MLIHPTAVVHPSLDLPPDAEVGPYALLDEGISLGSGVRIGPFCHIYPGTILESHVRLEDGVVLGNRPQDRKYRGEVSGVRIGAGACLREYVTVNRATAVGGFTSVGPECLIMAYAHVAHDCEIGARAVVANGVHMAGHVRVGQAAVVSGMTGIHQFVSIGAGAFVGGNLRVDKDVLPFSKALGEPLRYAGMNALGMERMGLGPAAAAWLRDFYRRFSADGKAAALAAFAAEASGKETGSMEASPETGIAPGMEDAETGMARLRSLLAEFLGQQKRGLLTRPLS
jgi:UDP-N-acetylglucosamine acyltransferase